MATVKKARKVTIVCPFCGGTRIWSVGFTPTLSGPKNRYKCVSCAKTFFKPKRVRKPKAGKTE